MRTELPVCKRCCFCLPLRYGLLTWGYLNLIGSTLVSIAMFVTLHNMVELIVMYKNSYHLHHIITISIILGIFLLDVILNVVFIVGGHKKNVKLLRIYYYYNIVLWVLTLLLVSVFAILLVPSLYTTMVVVSYQTWLLIIDIATSFIHVIMHTYLLLLLRSEIIKLRSNCEFRFVNNAAEAECTMKFRQELVDVEKEMEDNYEKEIEDVCARACEKSCQSKGNCCSGK